MYSVMHKDATLHKNLNVILTSVFIFKLSWRRLTQDGSLHGSNTSACNFGGCWQSRTFWLPVDWFHLTMCMFQEDPDASVLLDKSDAENESDEVSI